MARLSGRRRPWRATPAVAVALAGLCVVLALAACGSSSKTPGVSHSKVTATAYVTSLCEAVAPFEHDIATRAKPLESAGSMNPARGKSELVGYLSSLSADGQTAVDKLRTAGVPEVNGGASFSASVLNTFTRLTGTLGRSETVAKNLSTSSQTVFHTGATNLATAVKESIGEISQGFSRQSNKALDAAASKVSACHQL